MILSSSYEVLTAEGGNGALEILRERPVDLVTVDLNMPGIKGDQLVGIIRQEFAETEIIIITGCATVDAAVSGIRCGVSDFLTKPFDVVQVNAAVNRALHRQQGRRRLVRFLEGLGNVVGRDRTSEDILCELEGSEELQARLQTLLEDPHIESHASREHAGDTPTIEFLELLANTIESRDPQMRGHARRVSFYAGLIADRMKLDAVLREQARVAAFLHDLGKVGLSPDVLPVGEPLSAIQRSAVEEHPGIGERLLQPLALASAITSALRHHHERWDGMGYPDGLRAEETPLLARVVAVADAFDAIVCKQQEAQNDSRRFALSELKAGAGSQFDAQVVGVFCEIAQVEIPEQRDSVAPSSAKLSRAFVEGAGEADRKGFAQ
jgi:response regulator RpfG family c-di-GMP phosphodiesterase